MPYNPSNQNEDSNGKENSNIEFDTKKEPQCTNSDVILSPQMLKNADEISSVHGTTMMDITNSAPFV